MASIRFNLDTVKGHSYLFLIYHCAAHDRLKMSMGEKINPALWDARKQRVKPLHPNATTLNTLMSEIRLFIDRIRNEYKIKGERLSSGALKVLIRTRMYGHTDSTFKDYATKWIDDKGLKKETAKGYKNAINIIVRKWPSLTFEDIDRKWRTDFIKHMSGNKINYTNIVMKRLKECMHSAFLDGVHKNQIYQSAGFLIPTEKVESKYLNMDQINHIYNIMDTFPDVYKNAAIIFLIGCLTGQRHQTYRLINKDMILITAGTRMISLITEKTKQRVSIPVSAKLEKLLNMEYHDISQQKLNEYIKEVCRLADVSFYKEITSHTARRSFATNAVLAGVDMTLIMKITGHTTESQFRKYVRMDDVVAATKSAGQIRLMQDL